MRKALLYVLLASAFITAAAWLLVIGVNAHWRYARAHIAADNALRAETMPGTLPESPEPFFREAQRATLGIFGLAIVALGIAWKTRHPVWFTCLTACVAIAIIAITETGVRY
jgi:hypothetical protein